jgi:hypothetical protein
MFRCNGRFMRRATAGLAGLLLLAACGPLERFNGSKEGASDDVAAAKVAPKDPLARPVQVAWTSARARYCGFIFDPARLRSDYLATEQSLGASPEEMQKLQKTYDYTYQSVTDAIKKDAYYCNKSRTDAIREALNHFLAGDYTSRAKIAQ